MRTPIYALIAALLFSGCTHYHVTPAGAPAPDRVRVPEPDPVEPLELDIGRPIGSHLLLQTNRPAYVAIFEIIPNRGVTLIYPAAAHQQNMLVSGLTWVPLWWSPKRVSITSDRYIYAVASEEPLRLSGETFHVGYFHRVLGLSVYNARNPYATMRAISREIVPTVAEEEWAEDVHILTPMYHTETYRTARIYCPGGRVFDVPEDMVARIWCPTRTRVVIVEAGRPRTRDYPVGRPARPDSVYGHGGGRIKFDPPRRRGPVIRVVDPSGRDGRDDRGRPHDPRRPGRDERDERDERTDRDEDSDKPEKPKRGRIVDLINEVQKQKQEKERQERERQEQERQEREDRRREAEEARRREAEERDEARRREADEREARRREAEERRDERKEERRDDREARKDERDERKEERKEERQEERDTRKDEREERREERRDEPKQQGQQQPREEKQERPQGKPQERREEKPQERREEKPQEKREEKPQQEKREEARDDNKGRRGVKDLVKDKKEKP